jgi:NAD+ diphosphatase
VTTAQVAFAGSGLDRADHIRGDAEALAGLMDWRARLLRLDGLDPQFDPEGNLAWGTLADAAADSELVFLGLAQGKACFAEVSASLAMSALGSAELATYGTARALVDWHARHRYCARCGNPTVLAKGGWQRSCTNAVCKGEHFPRVDPVTIMLVEHQGMLLLGRQPRFPPRRYSALAGFLEPGESIEEAVAREVKEEAGVTVRDVSYVASQPWPFPSSLMIGCHSYADNAELTIDHTELEEADWFSREEVAAAMAGDESGRLLTPPSQAIAHHLLKWWLAK